MLAYKRPQTLGNFVNCYNMLSVGPLEGKDGSISVTCGKCALGGYHGSHNSMVPLLKHIRASNEERRLTQKLNCKGYGIYAACYKNCDNYYVGQTMTFFSQHRTNIEYYETSFATLKIMTIRTYLDIIINIIRKSLLASLIERNAFCYLYRKT